MAKLSVPPLDPELAELMAPVAQSSQLADDAAWESKILPLVIARLHAIDHSVRQALTTNAHTPGAATVDRIHRTISASVDKLRRHFAAEAPFTVARLAELLLQYTDSGYSLATVALAHKYVDAVARTLSVSSSESSFVDPPAVTESEKPVVQGQVSAEDYLRHNLPTNVVFKPLQWGKPEGPVVHLHSSPVRVRDLAPSDLIETKDLSDKEDLGSDKEEAEAEPEHKSNTEKESDASSDSDTTSSSASNTSSSSASQTPTTGTASTEPEDSRPGNRVETRARSKRGSDAGHERRVRSRRKSKTDVPDDTATEGAFYEPALDHNTHTEHRNEEVLI